MTDNVSSRVSHGRLQIAADLYDFVEKELTPGSGVSAENFWNSLEEILKDMAAGNSELLKTRDTLQEKIDEWHRNHRDNHDAVAYKAFLSEIGYLEAETGDFKIDPQNIDEEIASIPGAQLVVPVDNARYALNAANARWVSFYDALYGTDAIPTSDGCGKSRRYNPIRGDKVINFARNYLDRHFALEQGTHHWATGYAIVNGQLQVTLGDGTQTPLMRPERLVGYTGDAGKPDSILLRKNGLHMEVKFGEGYFIGRRDHANICDMHIESALTAIMDLEDSVASVDVEDKLRGYRNWLGLMNGSLKESFEKGGDTVDRKLKRDRSCTGPDGASLTLHGRSLMLVRNVGSHLYTDAVLYNDELIPETMLDAMVTALAGKIGLASESEFKNSRAGSIYIVKPKMHGSTEVAHAVTLFGRVEDALDIPRNTMKMGIMDEERRTTVNLKNCIAAARERVFFINTGFLDRTGDEIHTDMEAGPVLPKAEMKGTKWLAAYEDSNVDIGLETGFSQRAQIGKGMWAMPDEMNAMLHTKIGHPNAGANTAWVPSPTAAALHSTHYMLLDVLARQADLVNRQRASLDDILEIPLLPADRTLDEDDITREIENNAQGILGYVARWVGQGVGCSKVPDINNVYLMEDCATLRISSQHIANWLHHGIIDEQQVREAMERMAVIVDRQNAGDPEYEKMSDDFAGSIPFQAALDLALKGRDQANGYTEFILYARRQEMKAKA